MDNRYKTIFNMGTVTNAMRGKSILERYGCQCRVERVTDRARREGCGYSLGCFTDFPQAEHILRQNGLSIRSIIRTDDVV